jgi:uncharacterized membrane protein
VVLLAIACLILGLATGVGIEEKLVTAVAVFVVGLVILCVVFPVIAAMRVGGRLGTRTKQWLDDEKRS